MKRGKLLGPVLVAMSFLAAVPGHAVAGGGVTGDVVCDDGMKVVARWIAAADSVRGLTASSAAEARTCLDRAVRECRVVTLACPEREDAYDKLTSLLARLRDYGGAAKAYERVVDLAGRTPEHLHNLGYLYTKAEEWEAAVATFEELATTDTLALIEVVMYVSALRGAGHEEKAGRASEVLRSYEAAGRAWEETPDAAWIHELEVLARDSLKDRSYDRAIEAYVSMRARLSVHVGNQTYGEYVMTMLRHVNALIESARGMKQLDQSR